MNVVAMQPLQAHVTIPPDISRQCAALSARMSRIARVLESHSALPAAKTRAKDELVQLSKAALELWSLV